MVWIESHQSLLNHPKTKRAARLLGIERVQLIGHLHCLWWWCMDYAPNGDISRFPDDVIADACEWSGDAPRIIGVLVDVGFLDRDDDLLVVHDWMDYAGKLVERKRANAERMRKARANEAKGTYDARALHVQDTCGATNQPTNQPTNKAKENGSHEPVADAPAPVPIEKKRPRQKPAVDNNRCWPLWEEACALIGVDAAGHAGKGKQMGAIGGLLDKGYSPDDVLGCYRWLLADGWEKQRGVDFIRVGQRIDAYITAGRPDPAKAAARFDDEDMEIAINGYAIRRHAH